MALFQPDALLSSGSQAAQRYGSAGEVLLLFDKDTGHEVLEFMWPALVGLEVSSYLVLTTDSSAVSSSLHKADAPSLRVSSGSRSSVYTLWEDHKLIRNQRSLCV